MIIAWRVLCFDRQTRQDSEKWLHLDTRTLPPVQQAAVELTMDTREYNDRSMVKFRNLFAYTPDLEGKWGDGRVRSTTLHVHDYLEDEHGKEISHRERVEIVTGKKGFVLVPQGAKQHDIDYMLSERQPFDFAATTLDDKQIDQFRYFIRDLDEMKASAFLREGSGTISIPLENRSAAVLETAVSSEEIAAFIQTFRRLYMTEEPANFIATANTFVRFVRPHPVAKYVDACKTEFTKFLTSIVKPRCPVEKQVTFTVQKLLNAHIYTGYAHQPKGKKWKEDENYIACLNEVGNVPDVLMFLFLGNVELCAKQISAAGKMIKTWFEAWEKHHVPQRPFVDSFGKVHTGLGSAETRDEKIKRVFAEKVQALAKKLWEQNGSPMGGHLPFMEQAMSALKGELGK